MGQVESVRERLEAIGQGHVLAFHDRLAPEGRRRLLAQIEALDLEGLPRLIERYVKRKPEISMPADLAPAPYYPCDPESPARPWDRGRYRSIGEDLIRRGKVAAFTVAGGQGTRLGFDGPKGCFPAAPVTGKPLFAIFAEGVLAARRKYSAGIPWYIMTSPQNHEATVRFFESAGFFGLPRPDVVFFPQGVMPSLEIGTGRLLLGAADELATNPDGHGGSLKALAVSGALGDMRRRGVEHISYFHVDNPLVKAVDPVFLGLHAAAPDSSAQMSSKMVPKAYPGEKVGVFCVGDGRLRVIEYSDLPGDLAEERDGGGGGGGELRFRAGSIAVHALSVGFVHRLNTGGEFSLPFHRAEKKVPFVDPRSGRPVEPQAPNAVKLERFVFDALPLCDRSIVLETDRLEEFAPIKNATGIDSAESSRELQSRRAARWLESRGVPIPRDAQGRPDCTLEISPLTALEPSDLRDTPARVEPGSRLAL